MSGVQQKIDFILELDKLKAVLRRTKPVGLARFENSAEHSWHTALAAMVLLEDAPEEVDALRVLKMMLVHDVVEIDTGDVFTYDEAARLAVAREEEQAAKRIFGLLPSELADELYALWMEFEAEETADARFAKGIDKVCPVLQNLAQKGQSWKKNGINRQQVINKNASIARAAPDLWADIENQLLNADYFEGE